MRLSFLLWHRRSIFSTERSFGYVVAMYCVMPRYRRVSCFFPSNESVRPVQGQKPRNQEKRVAESKKPISLHPRKVRFESKDPHFPYVVPSRMFIFLTRNVLSWGAGKCPKNLLGIFNLRKLFLFPEVISKKPLRKYTVK